MISEAIREARISKKMTQNEVGSLGYMSAKLVSAIECGKRGINTEALEQITIKLNNPRLYMEAAAEVTGGVYCSPYLDGSGVDLHRTSVWAKTIEELDEAEKALESVKVINKKQDDNTRGQVFESMIQALDARVAIDHYVAVMCNEYGFSIRDVFLAHRRKLEEKGYKKPEKEVKA